jgi:hypothetical protein
MKETPSPSDRDGWRLQQEVVMALGRWIGEFKVDESFAMLCKNEAFLSPQGRGELVGLRGGRGGG